MQNIALQFETTIKGDDAGNFPEVTEVPSGIKLRGILTKIFLVDERLADFLALAIHERTKIQHAEYFLKANIQMTTHLIFSAVKGKDFEMFRS